MARWQANGDAKGVWWIPSRNITNSRLTIISLICGIVHLTFLLSKANSPRGQHGMSPTRTTSLPNCSAPSTSKVLDRDAIASAAALHARRMGSAQRRAFQHAASAVEDASAQILALGGSVMAGGACHDPKLGYGHNCAYPSRFATFLEACSRRRGQGMALSRNFYFENRAIPATNTAGVLPQLPSLLSIVGAGGKAHAPHLLIIDFSVNDVVSYADANGTATLGDYFVTHAGKEDITVGPVLKPDAVLSVPSKVAARELDSFLAALGFPPSKIGFGARPKAMSLDGSAEAKRIRVNEGVVAATEVMLRYVLSQFPAHTAVVLMDGSCCVSRANGRNGVCAPSFRAWFELSRRSRALLAAAYGLPYLAYEEVLNGECTNANYHANYAHPNAWTHIVMMEALSLWWTQLTNILGPAPTRREQRASSSVPLRPPLARGWARFDTVCQAPLSTYDPRALFMVDNPGFLGSPGVRLISGNWSLYADRVGKPGWISQGPKDSEIEFDLLFGRIPRVTVVYDQRCAFAVFKCPGSPNACLPTIAPTRP